MRNEITNMDDIIDSRDVIARIEELESLIDEDCPACDGCGKIGEAEIEDCATCEGTGSIEPDSDEYTELKTLQELAEQCKGYSDWEHGETLIRDSYFQNYAQELADDCGMMNEGGDKWPYTCIDWERAARELQYDYTQVDFNGVDYWIRSC